MFFHAHSYYSFRYGIKSPEALIEAALRLGYSAVLIAEINNSSSAILFYEMAVRNKIKPLLGIDFRNGIKELYLGIALNNKGFEALNRYLSFHLESETEFPEEAPEIEDVVFVYPSSNLPETLNQSSYLRFNPVADSVSVLKKIPAEKLMYFPSYTFENQKEYNMHRLLRAIDENVLLSQLVDKQQALFKEGFKAKENLIYAEEEGLLTNHYQLEENANVFFETGSKQISKNKSFFTESREEDEKLIRKLCEEGLKKRYKDITPDIKARLKKELEIIIERNFVSYFLINWDMLNYARSKNYFYVGRGSGANSIVAYLLYITDVDPIELDLYFERFINMYRQNPPDFDIDFSWTDRNDVLRYLFRKYPNASLLGTYNTFQYRSVIRELGKVFGLPKEEIDSLSEGKSFSSTTSDQILELIYKYAKLLHGFPSHISIHAGGVLIPEKSIHYFGSTFKPPKGMRTLQIDMVVAEDAGLHKFDILSQRGLSKISDTLEAVEQYDPEIRHKVHDMTFLKKDPRIKKMIREGDTIGCFYVESPAMRMLLRKLEVEDYLGLVAASSIIRPGVAKSGMMREYILRYRFPEKRKEADPTLLEIMPETYGIMVYQEDVIKVAHIFGGLTLAEADALRRGMSGKYRSKDEFQKAKKSFFIKSAEKGKTPDVIREVWRQIESFAGYAFAKGHSASYAVESFQALYLKAYFPLEYMAATINNGGGFYRAEFYLHEARMKGANLKEPCVNQSFTGVYLYGKDMFLGLGFIRDLEDSLILKILQERDLNGVFKSMEDFLLRVNTGLEQLLLLIRANSFRFTKESKKTLLWRAHARFNKTARKDPGLFPTTENLKTYHFPKLQDTNLEMMYDQMELLGFTLELPFSMLKKESIPEDVVLQKNFKYYRNKKVRCVAYLVATKNTKTSGGSIMNFGTFLDKNGDFVDTVHFPNVAARFPFKGKACYLLEGLVVEEFDFLTLEIHSMERLPYQEDPRFSDQ